MAEVNLIGWKWLVPTIQNSKESSTESNVSIFVRLEMGVQHSLIASGLQKKFIVVRDLSQSGRKDRTMIASLIIPSVVAN